MSGLLIVELSALSCRPPDCPSQRRGDGPSGQIPSCLCEQLTIGAGQVFKNFLKNGNHGDSQPADLPGTHADG